MFVRSRFQTFEIYPIHLLKDCLIDRFYLKNTFIQIQPQSFDQLLDTGEAEGRKIFTEKSLLDDLHYSVWVFIKLSTIQNMYSPRLFPITPRTRGSHL